MPQTKKKKDSPLEKALAEAIETTNNLELKSERADAVRLAVQALLLMRGALDQQLFRRPEKFNPYPVFVKYIRASNAETLGSLVHQVLVAISPNFTTLRSLGELAEAIYRSETELDAAALRLGG